MVDRSKRVELVEAGNNVMVLNDSQATDPESECSVAARDCQLETGSLNVAVGQPQTLTYLSQAETGAHPNLIPSDEDQLFIAPGLMFDVLKSRHVLPRRPSNGS